MKKQFTLSFFLFILCWHAAQSQEFRGAVSATTNILPQLEAKGEIELRRVYYPGPYINRTFQAQLNYNFTKRLELGITYGFSMIQKDEEFSDEAVGEISERNKLAFDVEYQTGRYDNELKFSNRFRFQIATLDDNRPKAYLRNKFTVDYKVSKLMNPYVAAEPYFNIRAKQIKAIRAYIGNEFPLLHHSMELYYITEVRMRDEHFISEYIIGAVFKFDFRK